MIKRINRLRNAYDFQRVRSTGEVYKHPLLILITAPSTIPLQRVGIIAGKGLGNAAHRNLVKRRIRACIAQYLPNMQGGRDIIVIARKRSVDASFCDLNGAVLNLLQRSGCYSSVD